MAPIPLTPTRTLDISPSDLTPGSIRLTVLRGRDAPKSVVLEQDNIEIGRAEGADLRLTDPFVSKRHLILRLQGSAVEFQDSSSKNPVRVGGVSVMQGRAPSGSIFSLGETDLLVEFTRACSQVHPKRSSFGALVGTSEPMQKLFASIEKCAKSEQPVLIHGESGTGKGLVAREIHERSIRRGKPFVLADCTLLNDPVHAESKLFGYEKGAFTGATSSHRGYFEEADGGTVFLDEVGELKPCAQALLLQIIDKGTFQRMGGSGSKKVNVRILAATWHNLAEDVSQGKFREDLYHRFGHRKLMVPSMRERHGDLSLLVEHFWQKLRQRHPERRLELSQELQDGLQHRSYRGNVRDLEHLITNLFEDALGPIVSLADLDGVLEQSSRIQRAKNPKGTEEETVHESVRLPPFKEAKWANNHQFEQDYAIQLKSVSGGNITRAADIAQVERQSVRELFRRHKLYSEHDENPSGDQSPS